METDTLEEENQEKIEMSMKQKKKNACRTRGGRRSVGFLTE